MFSRAAFLCLMPALVAFAPTTARAADQSAATIHPDAIIRKAVALEVANDQKTPVVRFTYTKTSPNGVFVKDVIQTRDGEVSRLVSVNGKPLSPERSAEEQQRLTALLAHPSDQARHRRHEVEDQKRVDQLIQELPDAFTFTYTGMEASSDGPVLHFTFVPNPNYAPPNIEARAFAGMSGSIWIARSSFRFVKLKAHLTHDIRVGWGIVATFRKGGTLWLANQKIGHGDWVITRLKLDVDGSALMFKPIHIHITEVESNFHFLPPDTTWQQAVTMLSGADSSRH